MQQYRTRHSVKFRDFSFSNFDIFRRENDDTKLAPNFAFSIMGCLITVSGRPCYKDLKFEKKIEICLFPTLSPLYPLFLEINPKIGLGFEGSWV